VSDTNEGSIDLESNGDFTISGTRTFTYIDDSTEEVTFESQRIGCHTETSFSSDEIFGTLSETIVSKNEIEFEREYENEEEDYYVTI
jgi:hypothetical protein